jgi:hypothetical protein
MSKKDIILNLFSIIVMMFIAYLLIGGYIKKKSLDSNLGFTDAVVIDNFYSIRTENYFTYKFSMNEKLYQGSGKHYPKSDTLLVGDTILIVYDKTNPDNNKPYRDY